MAAVDPAIIGTVSAPATFEVEKGAIRKFAEAIGDPDPAYQRGEIAPPTFPTTFRVPVPGLAGIDPARFIHGSEEYTYQRPLRAGDVLTCRRRVADVFTRTGKLGEMTFVVAELEGRDPAGALVFTGKTTLIIHGRE